MTRRLHILALASPLLLVLSATAQAVELDDLEVTIQVIESDRLNEISHELSLPDLGPREEGRDARRGGRGHSGDGEEGRAEGGEHRSAMGEAMGRDEERRPDGREVDEMEGREHGMTRSDEMNRDDNRRMDVMERDSERVDGLASEGRDSNPMDDGGASDLGQQGRPDILESPGSDDVVAPERADEMRDLPGDMGDRRDVQEHAREISEELDEQSTSFREEYEDSEKAEEQDRQDIHQHRHDAQEHAGESQGEGMDMRESAVDSQDAPSSPAAHE